VNITCNAEREDDTITPVIAPFFPQVCIHFCMFTSYYVYFCRKKMKAGGWLSVSQRRMH
jgi:hypothetical protein